MHKHCENCQYTHRAKDLEGIYIGETDIGYWYQCECGSTLVIPHETGFVGYYD